MQLNYRGVSYEYTPPAVETSQGEFSGRYRGLDWRFCSTPKHYTQQPNVDLIYRGVSYQATNSDAALAGNPAVDRTRELIMKNQRSINNRQQSMLTRLGLKVGLSA